MAKKTVMLPTWVQEQFGAFAELKSKRGPKGKKEKYTMLHQDQLKLI